MPRTRRTDQQKHALVEAWRRSGLSCERFAREHGISANSLRAWQLAFTVPAFLPVRVVESQLAVPAPALVVQLAGSGHRVEVPGGFDAATLRRLVDALC